MHDVSIHNHKVKMYKQTYHLACRGVQAKYKKRHSN